MAVVERISDDECIVVNYGAGIFRHRFRGSDNWYTCELCGDLLNGGEPQSGPIFDKSIIVQGCSDYRATRFPLKGIWGERYARGHTIGHGGFGKVIAGVSRSGLKVAIKKFVRGSSDSERERDWRRELEIPLELEHPYIVRVLDAMKFGATHYIVYERASEDLVKHVKRVGPASDEKCLTVARKLLRALGYLHDRPMLHRDIKPQNVLVMPDGNFKLADFSIARRIESWDEIARTFVGTPAYMPPEVLRDEGFTVQSDLYQLGLVLYFLRTGRNAVDATRPTNEIFDAILAGAPRHAAERLVCSTRLRTLITVLLRRTLCLRYLTAEDAYNYAKFGIVPWNTRISTAM